MKKHDLELFLEDTNRQIQSEYFRIQGRVKEDPGTAGDQGEENWATLLRDWLPTKYQIVTKGRIINSRGQSSPQVDIIILKPEYPKKLLDRKYYLAGGVIAAFECKLSFALSHLKKFFSNAIKIKALSEIRYGYPSPYRDLQSTIFYGLLAHSSKIAHRSNNLYELITKRIYEIDESMITHPIQSPDLICIADIGCWSIQKFLFSKEEVHTCYMGYLGQSGETTVTNPISALVTAFLFKLAKEDVSLRSLAQYFDSSQITHGASGLMRKWDVSVLSDEVRKKKGEGFFQGSLYDDWSLWLK